jgi:hypothetical protein
LEIRQVKLMQRYGLAIMVLALAVLFVLHNPSAGYQTATTRYEPWPLPVALSSGGKVAVEDCAPPNREQRDALMSQKMHLGHELGECRVVELGFFEWRSAGALVPYIATVRKVLVIAGVILFVGLGWVWVLADPKLQKSEDDAAGARREFT